MKIVIINESGCILVLRQERREVIKVKKVKGIPRYTDPDAMRSDFVHEKRDRIDEMQSRLDRMNNRSELRSFDLEKVSKMLDWIGHFERTRK